MGDGIEIEVSFRSDDLLNNVTCWAYLKNQLGMNVFGVESEVSGECPAPGPVRSGVIRCRIDSLPLVAGVYVIDLSMGSRNMHVDQISDACRFEVHPVDVFGTGRVPHPSSGSIFWPSSWSYAPEREPALPAVGKG